MYGLSQEVLQELLDILASIPEIEEAIIYGSRARGDYRRASDIDLSLKGEALTTEHVARLKDKLYYSSIPYFFDINLFSKLRNPVFAENIKRDGKVLYKRASVI